MNPPFFLAADIGATKTHICLYIFPGRLTEYSPTVQLKTADFSCIEELLAQFLCGRKVDVSFCAIGVPGPVNKGKAKITNLPWQIDEKKIQYELNVRTVRLINDLEATAYALTELEPEDFFALSAVKMNGNANKAIIAPGSGLGQAFLSWDGLTYRSIASEGGHGDFAPNSRIECDLLRFLQKEFGHVSYERVCSGQGIHNIYRFLKDHGHDGEPAWLNEAFKSAKANPVPLIIEAALNTDRQCPICVKTINLFSSVLGAEAGNFGLRVLARGGVYLAGGLPQRVLPFLKETSFLDAFHNKGRTRHLIEEIPVHVITNPETGLIGAARYGVVHLLPDHLK